MEIINQLICKNPNCQTEIELEMTIRHEFDMDDFDAEVVCPNCEAVYQVEFFVAVGINKIQQL